MYRQAREPIPMAWLGFGWAHLFTISSVYRFRWGVQMYWVVLYAWEVLPIIKECILLRC